jgi:putative thiazole/oxazole-modified microcin (TOMM)-like peptide
MAESIYILGAEDRRKFARLIAAAWRDAELRGRYERAPREVLAEYGIDYPAEVPTPPLPPMPDRWLIEAQEGGTISVKP